MANLKKIIIKNYTSPFNIDYLFTKEGKQTITCYQLYESTNIKEIESEISEIVFSSEQEDIIKNQIQ